MASTLLLIEFNSSIWFLASSRRPEISAVFDIIVLVVVEVISDEVASAGFVVIVIVWDVVGALGVVVLSDDMAWCRKHFSNTTGVYLLGENFI